MTRLLIFSIVKTIPDIIFFILILNKFAKNLSHQYIKIVKTIFYYLKDSRN